MSKRNLLILTWLTLATFSLAAATVTTPTGETVDAASTDGWFWTGFGVGCVFYGFRFIKRLAQRATGHAEF